MLKAITRQVGLDRVNRFTECYTSHNIKLEPAIGRLIICDKKQMWRMPPDRQHYKIEPCQNIPETIELIGLHQQINIATVFDFLKLFIAAQNTIADICLVNSVKHMQQ